MHAVIRMIVIFLNNNECCLLLWKKLCVQNRPDAFIYHKYYYYSMKKKLLATFCTNLLIKTVCFFCAHKPNGVPYHTTDHILDSPEYLTLFYDCTVLLCFYFKWVLSAYLLMFFIFLIIWLNELSFLFFQSDFTLIADKIDGKLKTFLRTFNSKVSGPFSQFFITEAKEFIKDIEIADAIFKQGVEYYYSNMP